MGYDLIRDCGGFHLTIHGWGVLLETAKAFGWTAEGTFEAEYDDDCSLAAVLKTPYEYGYGFNDGQVVTTMDAVHLAAALEEALRQYEEVDARSGDVTSDAPAFYTDWQDEESRETLRESIAFFKRGQFEIW